ncbi:MAG: threonine/serine dehydratase [Anaerolinea sp.]|nr:threonine/serine dehydratase [Anaerolinea sp.]
MMLVTLDEIYAARERLRPVITRTRLFPAGTDGASVNVYVKPESFQPIGSFKLRGAYNKVAALVEQGRPAGIVAHSSGNHAQGVAYAARALGLPSVIVMPNNAPPIKVDATRALDAEIVFYDVATQTREQVTEQIIAERGWALVHPFADPLIIAGQGTIGLEIFEDFPDVEQVIVPIGGGGLISGVAAAIKHLNPAVKVIGVEPELAADARDSFVQGRVVAWAAADTNRTIADGTRTLSVGAINLEHMQAHVDAVLTVSEDDIRAAVRRLALNVKLVTEPSGALPFAAWIGQREKLPVQRNTVMVLSGGNIDPALLAEIVGR